MQYCKKKISLREGGSTKMPCTDGARDGIDRGKLLAYSINRTDSGLRHPFTPEEARRVIKKAKMKEARRAKKRKKRIKKD